MEVSDLKNKSWPKYLLAAASILLFVGAIFFLVFYLKPEKIISFIGTDNTYLLMFVTAIFGGFTTFNIIPYHPLLITLSLGGLNPLLLGFLAAAGVSLGDSTSYFLGYQGRSILPENKSKWFVRIHDWAQNRPKLFIFFCFLYSTFTPLSNDLITIPAGLAKVPFWKVMTPLFFGNLIFDIALAFLSPEFYELFQKVFF